MTTTTIGTGAGGGGNDELIFFTNELYDHARFSFPPSPFSFMMRFWINEDDVGDG